jgi:acyl-[acyl carrier protein]--UDP-N-acetylglucosamine O-acyltransferase
MKQIYTLYFRSKIPRTKALDEIKNQFPNDPVGKVIVDFIEKSNRGII